VDASHLRFPHIRHGEEKAHPWATGDVGRKFILGRRHRDASAEPSPSSPLFAGDRVDADKVRAYLESEMQKRIMVIDGAMGTTIQQYKFSEADFRGEDPLRNCPR